MSDASQDSLFDPTHLNQGLFSDYYLDELVPTFPEWEDGALFAQARKLRDDLRLLLASVQPEALDEAQLEELWIKPVLEWLGHYWSVQVKIRYRERGFRKPDYIFAASDDDARALTNRIYDPAELAHALAVGDAKKWGAKLDQAAGDLRNPSQQIDEYLRYSELPWGILTDGRTWRLYHRDSSKSNSYYAVDLQALLLSDADRAVENFYYFYLFFRREAFSKADDGWLNRVLQGSVDYAEALSHTLEEEVYDALELIAQGFFNFRRNRLKLSAATLRTVYEQSLVLLYRLLFILYAESRGVLPMDEEVYAQQRSLRALSAEVFRYILERGKDYYRRVDEAGIYARLSALFFAIDAGSPEYGVPPYNGRLFSEDDHPFLAEKAVGDAFLAPALDKLVRMDVKISSKQKRRDGQPARVFVDYRDLDVRHLGAVYEKLLEYQLDIASEPLTLHDGKYVPARAGDKVIKQPGQVYLRTGSNERKITGSYYTPGYITRFIVERTLEPLLTEIAQQHAELDADGHWIVRDADGLRRAVLELNILDPATGSGHFLVEAVNYMAEWLRNLALRPADLDPREDELAYWKRQVVTACLYGVDVNPLAVELARVSLWLATATRDKPLSFLDHHIRVGNSLVGARMTDIRDTLPDARTTAPPAGQLALFDEANFTQTVVDAVGSVSFIENVVVHTVAEVKEQEARFDLFRREVALFELLADTWTARHFGLNLDADSWRQVWRTLAEGKDPTPEAVETLRRATALAVEHRFLHWDLVFPEVFFDADGTPLPDGGFDAVIGNPPYVRQERIQPYKPYFEAGYAVHKGTADLFLYFYERALTLVKPSRRVGYVTSGTFMNSDSASAFRRYIHAHAGFEAVVNFGENQPFRGAEMVYPTIAVLKKGKPAPTFRSLFVEDVYRRAELGDAIKTLPLVDTSADVTALDEWRFQSVELTNLFKKITQGYSTLGEVVGGKLYRGITTGLNEAFVVDQATRDRLVYEHSSSADILKPLLRGEDLRPWYQIDTGLYLIFARRGINVEDFVVRGKFWNTQ